MRSTSFVAIALCVAVAAACEGSFCDRVDYGTCGNACCKMSFDLLVDPVTIVSLLNQTLTRGGSDGRYTAQMTAEGTLLFADLRPYNLTVDFIGQVHHFTKVHHYNDTINMLVSESSTGSTLEMFSTSQIAGAFGDASQNYANIMNIVAPLGIPYKSTTVFGCPAPAAPAAPATVEALHASCKANYTFTASACHDVSRAIVAAAGTLSGFSNCGSGEKCGYSIDSASDLLVTGKHETPTKHYKDDLSFALTPRGDGCEVGGYSTSETWYAVLDDGTNYCNLHNLIAATGLSNTENVDKDACTQYSSADCSKY